MDYLRRVRERQKFPSLPISVRNSDLSSPSFTASDSDDDGQNLIPQIREDLSPPTELCFARIDMFHNKFVSL
jgi:hypothetical protein